MDFGETGGSLFNKYKDKDKCKHKYKDKHKDKYKYKLRLLYVFGREMTIGV